jgi:hypothetical protein
MYVGLSEGITEVVRDDTVALGFLDKVHDTEYKALPFANGR